MRNRHLYPDNWEQISLDVRTTARWQCECRGECATARHVGRCDAVKGEPHPYTRSIVILTTAHVDRDPDNCDRENLRAMCQHCHLAYDVLQRIASARRTREARRTYGMAPLFDLPEAG